MRIVLLAGGKGSSLWPLSTEKRPKQFCKIFSCRTLLEETYERVRTLGDVTVVAPKKYLHMAKKILGREVSYIQEQEARGTSFAITEALKAFKDDEHVIFFPCDHYIENMGPLSEAIEQAKPFVTKGKIVAFGIKPTSPETRFGYIEMANDNVISQFYEKPPLDIAKALFQQTNIYWNSGIIVMTPSTLQKEWERLEGSKSPFFDKAIMEKTTQGIVIPVELNWNDIGTWASIRALLTRNVR